MEFDPQLRGCERLNSCWNANLIELGRVHLQKVPGSRLHLRKCESAFRIGLRCCEDALVFRVAVRNYRVGHCHPVRIQDHAGEMADGLGLILDRCISLGGSSSRNREETYHKGREVRSSVWNPAQFKPPLPKTVILRWSEGLYHSENWLRKTALMCSSRRVSASASSSMPRRWASEMAS